MSNDPLMSNTPPRSEARGFACGSFGQKKSLLEPPGCEQIRGGGARVHLSGPNKRLVKNIWYSLEMPMEIVMIPGTAHAVTI